MINSDTKNWNANNLKSNIKDASGELKGSLEQNVIIACEEALKVAIANTPPKGELRGRNMTSGNMAQSWSYRYSISQTGDISVSFENSQPYAPFVDHGHNVPKHFVPWLYVDDSGLLARHIPVAGEKLFGLVVGTVTQHVEGANITEKAMSKFNEVFEQLSVQTLENTAKIINS